MLFCRWFATALCWIAMWIAPAHIAHSTPLTLANTYRPDLDLTHYWVSEKYDGIRAYWDGQRLLSRQGLPIAAPSWFTHNWPQTPMDGELWAGRGQFAQVQSATAKGQPSSADWQRVQYMVFDLPQHTGPFKQRYQALELVIQHISQPWVQRVPQWPVDDHHSLMRQLRAMTQQGAEGLMLRRIDTPYQSGRTDDLLKLKLFDDAEAVVLAHLPGQGKFQGLTGALLVETPQGLRFKIGSGLSDADRAHPPPIGSTISYRYNGTHPSGLPRFARYWRMRSSTPLVHP